MKIEKICLVVVEILLIIEYIAWIKESLRDNKMEEHEE